MNMHPGATTRRVLALAATSSLVVLAACGDIAKLPVDAGTGTMPRLPKPEKSFIPTVDIAPAVGWPAGAKPTPAAGMNVTAFATGLDHPRWLHVLPNGDVLVAETNAPPRPEGVGGIRGWVMKQVMKRAGAAVPSADRITLLRDADGDGTAETRSVLLSNLASPFGMALVGDKLYVANTDAVVRFPYKTGQTRIDAQATTVFALPAGPRNHHWTKALVASPDGRRLYATVGSNSNVAEYGMAEEEGRAAIWEIDVASGKGRIFATGLRNPNGMDFEPATGVLWTVVNERDELGSDLVPDYLTSVKDGAFYGWPYSYYGDHVDERVQPQRPDLVAKALVPDYALGPHTASLGLVFARPPAATGALPSTAWPAPYGDGAFIGQHGSWNRKPLSGYKVVFVPFAKGRPNGQAVDVLTGFVDAAGDARGRPVGVVLDRRGALLVADDVGNAVWRVAPTATAGVTPPAAGR